MMDEALYLQWETIINRDLMHCFPQQEDGMGMVILQLAQAVMMQRPPVNMNLEAMVDKGENANS